MPAPKKKPAPVVQDTADTGNALIVLETIRASEVFVPGGCQHLIEVVEAEVAQFVPDISTEEGRKDISRFNLRIASSKTGLSRMATDLTEGWRKKTAEVSAERKRLVDRLEELQAEVTAPLVAWKAAEAARVDALNERLGQIRALCVVFGEQSSADLHLRIKVAGDIYNPEMGFDWQDFAELAAAAYTEVTASLRALIPGAEQRERDGEELRMLREKQAEAERKAEADRVAQAARDKAEADAHTAKEAARQDAEARVKAEGERAAKAELEASQAKEREAQAIRDSEARAAAAADEATRAEQAKQAAEKQRLADEEREREADKEHRAKINRAALAGIMQHVSIGEQQGIGILTAIAKGLVPNVRINY